MVGSGLCCVEWLGLNFCFVIQLDLELSKMVGFGILLCSTAVLKTLA